MAIVAGAGTAAAALLLLPWLVTLVGADAATFGFLPRSPIDLTDVLAFDTGSARAGIAPVGLLVAAMLPLVVATGSRLAWAGRAWMVALLSFVCAWLPSRLDASASVPAAEGVLVPAALALALAIGLGIAAFLEELRTFHFGWRQFAAVAAAVGLALPILAFAADTISGRWGLPTDDWPSRFAWMDEERANGDFKVLWIGDPTILPTSAKVVDDVGFGLTRQGPGDARSLWAPPEQDADTVLADAIALVQDQHTVRLGHLIAPTGVRYIAYLTRAAPDAGARGRRDPALSASLPAQLDLTVSRVEPGAIVYENEAWLPGRATVPPGTDVPVDSKDPLVATTRTALPGTLPVTGPVSDSDATGPGTLLWAEAANSGWKATLDGDTASRHDAFGWTNSFDLTGTGSVDLSFSGGARRLLVYVELLLWIGAAVVWWRSRARHRAGGFPMTRTSVPRLPLVLVLVIAAIVAIVIGNADPEPAPAAAKVDQAATLPTAGTRSSAWFCPGLPAAIPLEEQTLTVSNVGTESGDAIVTVFPDDGSPGRRADDRHAGRFGEPAAARAARARRRSLRGGLLARRRGRVRGRESPPTSRSGRAHRPPTPSWYFAAGTTGNYEANTTGRPGRGVAHPVQPVRHRRSRRRDAAHQRGGTGAARSRSTYPAGCACSYPSTSRRCAPRRSRSRCMRPSGASWPSSR